MKNYYAPAHGSMPVQSAASPNEREAGLNDDPEYQLVFALLHELSSRDLKDLPPEYAEWKRKLEDTETRIRRFYEC